MPVDILMLVVTYNINSKPHFLGKPNQKLVLKEKLFKEVHL